MSLYSSYWYRVAELKPRLRPHIQLFRHNYRGQVWHVLQDPASARQHRFNTTAYTIIGQLDGQRKVHEIWQASITLLGDEAPTQDEVIQLLGQLHTSDLLQSDISPDAHELFERRNKKRGTWRRRLANPLALRIPLLDPDHLLTRLLPATRLLMNTMGLLLWLIVIFSGVAIAILHWPELTANISDRLLTPENILLLWLIYPVIKLIHELAHALVIRHYGGEVHEAGIVILALAPIPYVDASASAAFPTKWQRAGVAAAGMMVELFIAALSLILWAMVEPGQVRAILFNIVVIGSVSTLLFNGNPLLRFDGYYILADLLEIPNLAKRSSRYLGYLAQRYLFGIDTATSPTTAPGEHGWFFFYGIAAFCYRLFVLAAIALFISGKFLIVGVLITLWALISQIAIPLVHHGYQLYRITCSRRRRIRFVLASLTIVFMLASVLFLLPVPLTTRTEGVVSVPKSSQVRAGTDCFITSVLVGNDESVSPEQPLVRCEDPFLATEVAIHKANLQEVQARYDSEPLQARVRRQVLSEQVAAAAAELDHATSQLADLDITSPVAGRLILPDAHRLSGSFVRQGETLGYVLAPHSVRVIVSVDQEDIARVRDHTDTVDLRFVSTPATIVHTSISRQIPGANDRLPSPVLGTNGGGRIPVDPTDPDRTLTLHPTFQVEIEIMGSRPPRIGERVYVRFNHGYSSLAHQWFIKLRNLFLSTFHV